MEDYGIWSVLPPFLAIFLAIRTKQVYLSLLAGIWLGWVVINGGNIWQGSLDTVEGLIDVFKDPGSTRTIMFSGLIGSLILLIQKSGGVQGFVDAVEKRLRTSKKQGKKGVQLLAWLTGSAIFIESNISVLTVGTLFRPIFDKIKISREKLAYIADSSSAPACILFPLNAWGAFIIGLLINQGIDESFAMMVASIKYNFYPILALLTVPMVILLGVDIWQMKKAEERTASGSLLWPESNPMISEELTTPTLKKGIKYRAFNMIVPIMTMILTMPFMLYYTGVQSESGKEGFLNILSSGSGSSAVLTAVIAGILACFILYKSQGIFKIREMADESLRGISEMMPLAILMLLAFAIGNVSKELNTGIYLSEITKDWLSPSLLPAILFIASGIIAFSTGTSWGTFGIMVPIGMHMAGVYEVESAIVLGAVLGGGIFGDHCSPISDTTIISSMAAATDHIDHVKTQLPYALAIGIVAVMGYLVVGILG